MEKEVRVDRNQLLDIQGRSRRRQEELANEWGVKVYPAPGGGCLLTDAGYSNRLRDLLHHTGRLTFDALNLLKVGRHFRLDPATKVIVGRDEADNNRLVGFAKDNHYLLEAPDASSPMTVLIGPGTESNLRKAAMITARYCSAKLLPEVRVVATRLLDKSQVELLVPPAADEDRRHIIIR
jgi:hypothetical protein